MTDAVGRFLFQVHGIMKFLRYQEILDGNILEAALMPINNSLVILFKSCCIYLILIEIMLLEMSFNASFAKGPICMVDRAGR